LFVFSHSTHFFHFLTSSTPSLLFSLCRLLFLARCPHITVEPISLLTLLHSYPQQSMLYERPLTRLTRAKLGLAFGSQTEQTPASNPPQPFPSASATTTSSASVSFSSAQDNQPPAAADLPHSQQQPQQLQLKLQKQQRKQRKQQPRQQGRVKKESVRQPVLPSPRPTKKISLSFVVGRASDDTADTANNNNNVSNNMAPNTPDYTSYSSSEQPSRPMSQERTRGGALSLLEVDTHSLNYSPSPYRTPTWSPESTSSSQQTDIALTQKLLKPKQEDSNFDPILTAAADAEDPLLSPLSLLSAVASVVGNRIGSPSLGNLVS
jgi:hypothetical protein